MKILQFFLIIVAVITSAHAGRTEPTFYHLSDGDEEKIKEAVSVKMLDPDSTRIGDLIAANDTDTAGLAYVCGKVSGRNTFGGYAQPTPFFGTLVDTNAGDKAFLVLSIAEPTSTSQAAVLKTCLKYMPDH